MSEIQHIVTTAAVTIFGSVLVFVIGQLLSKFLIEPTQELKKVIGEVQFNLAFHAPIIYTPAGRNRDRSDKAYEALMKSSCDLVAKFDAIPDKCWLPSLFRGFPPPRKDVVDASMHLRALSTYLHETGDKAMDSLEVIRQRVAKIQTLLGLEPLE